MTDLKSTDKNIQTNETVHLRTSVIFELAEQLLRETEIQYKNDNNFSDESLLSLNSFFGPVFERALDVLDNGKFVIYQSNDNLRKVVKVKGNKDKEYTLFYHINYCSCQAFKYKVLHSSKDATCKHILAARLAEITNKATNEVYTGKQIADILNSFTS